MEQVDENVRSDGGRRLGRRLVTLLAVLALGTVALVLRPGPVASTPFDCPELFQTMISENDGADATTVEGAIAVELEFMAEKSLRGQAGPWFEDLVPNAYDMIAVSADAVGPSRVRLAKSDGTARGWIEVGRIGDGFAVETWTLCMTFAEVNAERAAAGLQPLEEG